MRQERISNRLLHLHDSAFHKRAIKRPFCRIDSPLRSARLGQGSHRSSSQLNLRSCHDYRFQRARLGTCVTAIGFILVTAGCNGGGNSDNNNQANNNGNAGSDGPTTSVTPVVHATGDAMRP